MDLMIRVLLIFTLCGHLIAGYQRPCALREYYSGYVCVCNATYCDTLDDELLRPSSSDQIVAITTSERGLRFARNLGSWSEDKPLIIADDHREPGNHHKLAHFFANMGNIGRLLSKKARVTVDAGVRHQTVLGWGGSISTAVAYNLDQLPKSLERSLLESYFSDKTGLGYTMTRISIGGSDFDFEPWVYNESPRDDRKLSNFTRLDPRNLLAAEKIKIIQEIMEAEGDRKLRVKAAAWGCPPWMRSPEKFAGYGVLKPEYYQTWADYHLRFLELMKSEVGIDIWAISTGNEPSTSIISLRLAQWLSLAWWPDSLANFLADNLGPTIRKSQFNQTLILLGEEQRYVLPWFYLQMNKTRPEALDYADGIALHGYVDAVVPPSFVDKTHEAFPDKFLLNTEYSIAALWPKGPILGDWSRATQYIKTYFEGMDHHLVGFLDWNMVLDEAGGPTYIENFIDAGIISNATGGEAYKQPIFYIMGHFAKFLPEGSVRIGATSDWDAVKVQAYRRPDGTTALLLHNGFPDPVVITVKDERRGSKEIELPAASLSTVIYV